MTAASAALTPSSGAADLELGRRDERRGCQLEWGGVDHHCGMNAVKSAALKQQHLAATLEHFLGGRADDRDPEPEVVGDRRESNGGAHGCRGDHVVAASVPDSRQRVVFGAQRHVKVTRADRCGEGGRQLTYAQVNL
jgi:hypothetical protein